MQIVDNDECLVRIQGQDAGRSDSPDSEDSADGRQLTALLDDLLAIHFQLAQGVMPRAARITGTGQQLAHTVARVEEAICRTKDLIAGCAIAVKQEGHSLGAVR